MLSLREILIRAFFRTRGIPRVVNGVSLRVAPAVRALFTPDYDRPLADFLRDRVRVGDEVWNVGANVGIWTLQMASWVGSAGTVVAFEPNPATVAVLRDNVRLNGLEARVEIVQSAVGEHEGQVAFFAAGTDGMSRAGQANPALGETTTLTVAVTTLDRVAAARGTTPSWIVMDIEGWELHALRGARHVLSRSHIVVEMHPSAWPWSGHSRSDFEQLLTELRLRAVPISGQRDALADYGHIHLEPVTE